MHSEISVDSTRIARLTGLVDHNGDYINDATVTLESMTERVTGAAVTGVTFPVTLNYIAASNGNYEVEVSKDLAVVEGTFYIATFKAIKGTLEKVWKETVRAVAAVA